MPRTVSDFRVHALDIKKVDNTGKDLGSKVYWKLYAIENLIRVIVHSVLTVQIGPDWWTTTAGPDLQRQVAGRKRDYGSRPWHSTPGKHEVYYIFLSDLTKILTTHSAHFEPHIPDVDEWTARLEQVRLPRNIVGHMNWLTNTDRSRIDVCHADVQQLINKLASNPLLPLIIP